MKLDRHGITFNIWMSFVLFAVIVMVLLGTLQVLLIKPYYRNNKAATVREISTQIADYIVNQNGSSSAVSRAFQVTVDNNVCVAIYNEEGRMIYDADSLGSGCVFHASSSSSTSASINFRDGNALKNLVNENNGEVSLNLTNNRTSQEMVVYGKKISSNLLNLYLFVNSPLEPVDSIVNFFSQQYLLYTFFVIIVASIISIFISSRLTKPIVNIRKSADRLAKADYSVKFNGGRFTETKDLAETLNGATEKLSKIDELRKDLIANVSHDIKTPLTSIRAYAEMVRDVSGDNPAKRTEHLDVIIEEADYLNKLVVDMSELSKMQSGNYVLKQSNFDLSQVILNVVKLNQVMIEEGKLNVVTDIPESLIVYGDEIKITQVIHNFLSNAIKHSSEGKTITIKAWRLSDEETARVEVIDEGEGISKEELPYIWDRYQKSSRSFSRSMTSTGLGLAIVKAILDTHHARYGVVSEVGKGSMFWFELHQPHEPEDLEEPAHEA